MSDTFDPLAKIPAIDHSDLLVRMANDYLDCGALTENSEPYECLMCAQVEYIACLTDQIRLANVAAKKQARTVESMYEYLRCRLEHEWMEAERHAKTDRPYFSGETVAMQEAISGCFIEQAENERVVQLNQQLAMWRARATQADQELQFERARH